MLGKSASPGCPALLYLQSTLRTFSPCPRGGSWLFYHYSRVQEQRIPASCHGNALQTHSRSHATDLIERRWRYQQTPSTKHKHRRFLGCRNTRDNLPDPVIHPSSTSEARVTPFLAWPWRNRQSRVPSLFGSRWLFPTGIEHQRTARNVGSQGFR